MTLNHSFLVYVTILFHLNTKSPKMLLNVLQLQSVLLSTEMIFRWKSMNFWTAFQSRINVTTKWTELNYDHFVLLH
jgi:hypothetical protein